MSNPNIPLANRNYHSIPYRNDLVKIAVTNSQSIYSPTFLWIELFRIFHLWKVRFNISSPLLKSKLSIQQRFSSNNEILCAL